MLCIQKLICGSLSTNNIIDQIVTQTNLCLLSSKIFKTSNQSFYSLQGRNNGFLQDNSCHGYCKAGCNARLLEKKNYFHALVWKYNVLYQTITIFQTWQYRVVFCVLRYLCCIHTYAYLYWCMHNFGHVYVDMYAHFFLVIF